MGSKMCRDGFVQGLNVMDGGAGSLCHPWNRCRGSAAGCGLGFAPGFEAAAVGTRSGSGQPQPPPLPSPQPRTSLRSPPLPGAKLAAWTRSRLSRQCILAFHARPGESSLKSVQTNHGVCVPPVPPPHSHCTHPPLRVPGVPGRGLMEQGRIRPPRCKAG